MDRIDGSTWPFIIIIVIFFLVTRDTS